MKGLFQKQTATPTTALCLRQVNHTKTVNLHLTFEIITITGPIEACVFLNAYNPVQSYERYKSVQFNSIRSDPSVCASVRLSETVV